MGFAYEVIGRIFSRQQMRKLGGKLDASGLGFIPEAFAGFAVLICVLASLLSFIIFSNVEVARSVMFKIANAISADITALSFYVFLSFVIVFSIAFATITTLLIIHVSLTLMASARTRKVEDSLPDFLSLSAANMRAGMTIDQAMWYAAKPEFGILSEEVEIVAKKTFGGVPFNQSIDHLSEQFSSKLVKRAVALIKQGLASGGQLADILERTAEESRQLQILKKEIASSLVMYVIFIVFAGAIGTPFLFAVSGKLVGMIENVFQSMPATSSQSLATMGSSFSIPTGTVVSGSDFMVFTLLCVAMTAIISALIIGAISHGNKWEGVVYIPALVIVSFAVYFIISTVLSGFLGGLSP